MVKKALSWPARQIAINAGEDGSVVVGKIQENDTYAFGFDAQTGKFENLMSKGIIDPTKVVRTALQDAASIAGLLITTEAMVAEVPKKQSPAACHARWRHGRHGLLIDANQCYRQEGSGDRLGLAGRLRMLDPSEFPTGSVLGPYRSTGGWFDPGLRRDEW
jgi:hypothetical protein